MVQIVKKKKKKENFTPFNYIIKAWRTHVLRMNNDMKIPWEWDLSLVSNHY